MNMRNTILSTLVLGAFICFDASAQTECFDLIISEYVEGTGNNKCIEFFNTTNEDIALSA